NDRGDAKRLRCWARNSLFETDESATVEAFSTQNSASAAVMSSMAQRELRESPTALRVLVLDNSPDILELLSTDLKCRGCVVTTASVSAIRHGDIDGATFIE